MPHVTRVPTVVGVSRSKIDLIIDIYPSIHECRDALLRVENVLLYSVLIDRDERPFG